MDGCVDVWMNGSKEYNVLSSQCLTVLKDSIICIEDFAEEVLSKIGKTSEPNRPKSGYFLIEKCFYNDLREEKSLDLSEPVMTWLKERPSFGNYSAFRMEMTRFIDLKIRIGFPYLYVHAGSLNYFRTKCVI